MLAARGLIAAVKGTGINSRIRSDVVDVTDGILREALRPRVRSDIIDIADTIEILVNKPRTIQDSIILTDAMDNGSVVTLSGEININAIDAASPWSSISGIRVNDDGTIDRYTHNVGYQQIDASTDWIIPNASASSDYEFWLEVDTGSSPNYLSDSVDTWIAMGSGNNSAYLQWLHENTTPGTDVNTWTWTLRVRKNGGAEIDNAAYSGESRNEAF